jgi:hypothetical protein
MPDDRGHYYFNHGLSCLFEMPTSDARRLVPTDLQPLEVQHERSVLSVTVFDFYEGDGGAYQELVLAVLVPPLVKPGDPLPKAALFPFIVATSTERGRREGVARWKLPHLKRDVMVTFTEGEGQIRAVASADGAPILELTGTSHRFEPAELLFHTFVSDAGRIYKSDLTMRGENYSEHEFERGSLVIHPHEMTEGLTIDEIASAPFREQWMKKGVEVFAPLEAV